MAERDWFWEGNVQVALVGFLQGDGWTIVSTADTATKAHGVDLLAKRADRTLAVEVKGYPSTEYADPRRAHERKKTNPVTQAGHWYSEAVLKGMRLRSSMPEAEIALGFPDFPRYRAVLQETEDSLRRLGIGVYLVDEGDQVSIALPHSSRNRVLDETLLPFDGYDGGGRQLLGIPRFGGGSSRRDYGVPVFEQSGSACVYCGVDLDDTYEAWLGLSVDHVIPTGMIKVGYPMEWVEDLTNKVTCCRHCNEFLNQYRVAAPPPQTVEEFFDLRDQVFRQKRKAALERHTTERAWYLNRLGDRKPQPTKDPRHHVRAEGQFQERSPDRSGVRDVRSAPVEHTGKYAPLWSWLRAANSDSVTLTFRQVEDILGFPLPPSSRRHPAHWASYEGSAVARAILDAGWKASQVDLTNETILLSRKRL